uniref:Inter-alpha-trypsin inhibitor heavy chain 4 n=1 Tax=Falco tinnunculus TaxID=100819 RepID=A0A8C4UZL7_FALTI
MLSFFIFRNSWAVVRLVMARSALLSVTAETQHAIEIYSLHVDCKVTSRFAHTVITSKIVNRANESREATFEVELPKTAFITNFSMSIDGKVYPGIIKEKVSAQKEYDTAVSRGQSAGLVKITDRKLEQFHVSVSVAAASKVTFELMYEELLKRQLGKFELLLKVRPKQLVKHFQIDVHIFEPQGIRFLATDSTFMTNELTEALTKVQTETKAHISFKPTVDQQKINPELDETLLNGDFVVRYDVKRGATAGVIQIVNGYFVHYFAPHEMPVFPKNVIFVIDRSGSMAGRKIEQTRDALLKILQDLRPEDHFSFITFNSKVAEWKSSLLPATAEHVASATGFVQTLSAGGGTDINRALLTAVSVLDKAERLPERSVSMIILLTDGQPTSGESNVEVIQENVQKAVSGKCALFCLGFGFDVSYNFLEKMALSNGGIARRIYENADAALQLQGFYQEVATPILMKIEMQYPENAVERLTKNNFELFFEGSEIVVSGKIIQKKSGTAFLMVSFLPLQHVGGLTLKEEANVREKEQVFQNQSYIFGNFIERLWAYLTIQQLLEKSVSAQEEEQKALEARALELSLQYSFVTPLTSMVVTKPTGQQQMELANKPTEAGKWGHRITLLKRAVPGGSGIGSSYSNVPRQGATPEAGGQGLASFQNKPHGPFLKVKSPGFALVLSRKCAEGILMLFSEGCLFQCGAGDSHSRSLPEQKQGPAAVLPCPRGTQGLALPPPQSSLWLQEEKNMRPPQLHNLFP